MNPTEHPTERIDSGSHAGNHSGAHSGSAPGGPAGRSSDFSDTVRDMWRTRPLRSRTDRKIAGICGGIAERYAVDPTLARIAFVIAVILGGAGIGLYAAAWLCTRRVGDSTTTVEGLFGKRGNSDSKFLAVILLIVAVTSIPSMLRFTNDGGFFGASILVTIAMLAGWYGLHRRTPVPVSAWNFMTAPSPSGAARPGAASGGAEPGSSRGGDADNDGPHAATGGETGDRYAPFDSHTPPQWDPLGAAPFAWDLPDPAHPEHPGPEPRKRSRLTTTTLGIALIVAAVASGFAVLGDVDALTPAVIGALPLAVIGAGLLVGSFTRRGYGLLVVTGPLVGYVLLAALAPWAQIIEGIETQDRDVKISEWEAPGTYEFGIGDVRVDLSDLRLDEDKTMRVDSGIGNMTVILPPDLDVRVDCYTGIGNVSCPDGLDTGADGSGGPVLTLDVSHGIGDVEVSR